MISSRCTEKIDEKNDSIERMDTLHRLYEQN